MQLKSSVHRLTVAFALLVFIFLSCKNNNKSKNSDTDTLISEEFKEFYEKFGTDSVYQLQHIVFPLEGMRAMTESDDTLNVHAPWKLEEWVLQKSFDDLNGQFTQEFFNLGGIVIERIADTSGKFTMERRFGNLSSGWHLIYYKEMGMH